MSLAVDLLTWALLVPMLMSSDAHRDFWRHRMYCFESYNQHGFNAVMALGDLLLNRIPVELYTSGWLALWSSLYGVWSAAFYVRTGRYLYPFLDAQEPYAWVAYVGLFAVHLAAYLTVMGLSRAKQRYLFGRTPAAIPGIAAGSPALATRAQTRMRSELASSLPATLDGGASHLKAQ